VDSRPLGLPARLTATGKRGGRRPIAHAVAAAGTFPLFPELDAPKDSSPPPFRFIDLFAGIGGIRAGLENAGGSCVYTVEFDRWAMQTYSENFGKVGADGKRIPEPPRDIYDVKVADIPAYELLAAGFPCQPFSIAGVSKNLSLGREHGFEHAKSGTAPA